jgi:hypothetical protein
MCIVGWTFPSLGRPGAQAVRAGTVSGLFRRPVRCKQHLNKCVFLECIYSYLLCISYCPSWPVCSVAIAPARIAMYGGTLCASLLGWRPVQLRNGRHRRTAEGECPARLGQRPPFETRQCRMWCWLRVPAGTAAHQYRAVGQHGTVAMRVKRVRDGMWQLPACSWSSWPVVRRQMPPGCSVRGRPAWKLCNQPVAICLPCSRLAAFVSHLSS